MAVAALGLGLLLVLCVTLARRPFAGVSVPFVSGAAALALLAAWTLASASWSRSPARAIIGYDRVLLYLLAYLMLGALGASQARLRWLMRGVAAGAFVVCACGLVTRLAPDAWPVESSVAAERLSYPLTYWNALGLLAAVGVILCFAVTSDAREHAAGRVVAAGALPVLAATLLLTLSRGSIAACAVGLVAVVLVGRPRALLSGLLVAAPAVAVAVASAYHAELLTTAHPATAAATVQGHHVALVVALCVAAALLARTALLLLDRRMDRMSMPVALRGRGWRWAVGIGALAAVTVVVVASGAPDAAQRQYARFTQGDAIRGTAGDPRRRLTDPGNNGRLLHWRVALRDFRADPVRGRGAGTYALSWEQYRSATFQVENAHSLYLEILGELGVVGLVLVVAIVLLILGGLLQRARGPDRVVGAALFAAALAWALHAGIDWDWQMPAVTSWVFAAGGLALSAAPEAEDDATGPPHLVRVLAGLGLLILLLAPLSIIRSEGPLRDAQRALARGDCATAIARSLDAKAALSFRPEPSLVLGVCDVRLGNARLAVRALRDAVERDPNNWEYRYATALVRGAAGLDPRPAAQMARWLNPRSSLTAEAVRRFDTDDPATWRRRALQARLPGDSD